MENSLNVILSDFISVTFAPVQLSCSLKLRRKIQEFLFSIKVQIFKRIPGMHIGTILTSPIYIPIYTA